MNKAFFLDRDGVIIYMHYDPDHGTVDTIRHPDQVEFVFGIFNLLRETKKLGFLNIIVSNQPGIALKKVSEGNFQAVKEKVANSLKKEGVVIDAEYYCFHHPFAKLYQYRQRCSCRKPEQGLLLKAAKEHDIDLKQSFMIGDGVGDIIAGSRAGCKTILLGNIFQAEYLRIIEEKLGKVKPDYLVKKLTEAISIIESK